MGILDITDLGTSSSSIVDCRYDAQSCLRSSAVTITIDLESLKTDHILQGILAIQY